MWHHIVYIAAIQLSSSPTCWLMVSTKVPVITFSSARMQNAMKNTKSRPNLGVTDEKVGETLKNLQKPRKKTRKIEAKRGKSTRIRGKTPRKRWKIGGQRLQNA